MPTYNLKIQEGQWMGSITLSAKPRGGTVTIPAAKMDQGFGLFLHGNERQNYVFQFRIENGYLFMDRVDKDAAEWAGKLNLGPDSNDNMGCDITHPRFPSDRVTVRLERIN